jgi:predicted transcriptional regulator YdeE
MPKIEVKSYPKTIVVGVNYHGKNAAGEIPQLWEVLMAREAEVADRDLDAMAAYGVSIMGPEFASTQEFEYIAGYPVLKMPEKMPEGMAGFEIPAGDYAVITCPNLASLAEAYDALYNRWLPESEYTLDLSHGNFCFELYDEDFNPPAGTEKLYIYLPVKAK